MWQVPCYYCGYEIKTCGIDRVDNAKGYDLDNLKTCCRWCNAMKSNMSQRDFIALCVAVARRHGPA